MGPALAAAFQRGAGGRQVQGRDRSRPTARPQGPDHLRGGRAQPPRHDARADGPARVLWRRRCRAREVRPRTHPGRSQAIARAGWSLDTVGRVEINEAFAAIAIVVTRELSLPPDIVNVEGGAIAHGHPIGATGSVLTTRLIHAMRRDDLKKGVVTMCIGGGQGIALALEMIA